MLKKILLLGASAVVLGAVAAHAQPTGNPIDNIVTNQWYTGHFTGGANTGSPLFGGPIGGNPLNLGSNGPILPNFTTAGAQAAPSSVGGLMTAIVTLPKAGTLLVTDAELSGDLFNIFVNGAPAAQAPQGATGLIPGGQQAGGNFTSSPFNGDSCGEDISCALNDGNFSSGTFWLNPGINIITGNFLGGIGNGDMNFIVEPGSNVPEPATLSVLGLGLAALGFARRRR